eukprot:8737282-Pyramimonas_sp.AAC.1
MEECAKRGDSHYEWRLLKVLLRYGGRPGRTSRSAHLTDSKGQVFENDKQEAAAVIQHFGLTEDAEVMQTTHLAKLYSQRLHHDFLIDNLQVDLVPGPFR